MMTRPATPEDYDKLRDIHAQSGLGFPLPDFESALIEGIQVVVDDFDEIVLAAVAKRVPEIYLLAPKGKLHPMVKMEGISLLHSSLRDMLASKGYAEFFSFIHPLVEKSFGRHLQKWFGWEKTWQAYRIMDWKGELNAQRRS